MFERGSGSGRERGLIARALATLLAVGCGAPEEPAPSKDTPAPAQAGDLPDAEALLAESAAALGGADKFAAMKSYRSESTVDMGRAGLKGDATIWWRGDKFMGETDIPGFGLTKVGGDGEIIWAKDPINGLRTITEAEAEQASWSTSICMPCDWKRHFKSAKTTRVTKEGQREVADIEFTSASGDTLTLVIDLESKLPVARKYKQASPLGSTPTTIAYGDYRKIGDLKISHSQVVKALFTEVVTTVIAIELNVEIDDAKFQKPTDARPAPAPTPEDPEASVAKPPPPT